MEILIYVQPRSTGAASSGTGNTSQMWQAFDAVTDEPIGKPTRNPFFNAARALLAEGKPPATLLYLVAKGKKDTQGWHLRSKIEFAAKFSVSEPDRGGGPTIVPYVPYTGPVHVSNAGVTGRDEHHETE